MLDVLGRFAAEVDPYSIDESFLDLTPVPASDQVGVAERLRAAVHQWTGLVVSVGLGPSKTLAKLACDLAKDHPTGVCDLRDRRAQEEALAQVPVEDIWGIGRQRAAYLRAHGVETAYTFAYATDPAWVKRHLYVPVARTQWELRGVACLPLERVPAPRQQILCAKSFGRPVQELSELKEALADYTARVAAKARAQGSVGATVVLWLATNGFRQQEPQYSTSVTVHLPRPTAYVPELLRSLYPALERLYRPGFAFYVEFNRCQVPTFRLLVRTLLLPHQDWFSISPQPVVYVSWAPQTGAWATHFVAGAGQVRVVLDQQGSVYRLTWRISRLTLSTRHPLRWLLRH